MSVKRFLPNNEYQAAISANAPTAINPFATMSDLAAVAPTLQTVATAGSSANITTSFNVFVTDNTVELYSVNGTTGDTAALILDRTAASGFVYADGTSGESNFYITASSMRIEDSLNLQGVGYIADYSTQGIIAYGDRWIPDKGYVDSVAGGNTIYSADDSLAGNRKVTQGGNYIWFEGGDFHIGTTVGTGVFNVDSGADAGFITDIKRDFDVGVGGLGYKATVNARGSEVRTVRTNGTAFSIFNEWTIGSSRKSFDFLASVNENSFNIFDAGSGLLNKVRIGDEISWWTSNANIYGFGFGHTSPTNGTLDVKNMDVTFGGASLSTEVLFDYSANATVFGVGASDAAYKIKTYGGVNLDNGLATFDKTPVSNRNISITTQGLATNGTGVLFSNAQALAGDIAVGQFLASGSTTNNTALSLRAINASSSNLALSIIAGDISARQATTNFKIGVTGFLANTRFALINEGTYTTGFDVYSNKAGDNTGYSARGSSGSSVGGNQYGFKASNGTGAANNTYAFHGDISAGGATANTANVYGYYLDWNGPGSTRTASGLQKGLYFDMRLNATTNETITGDIFGTDILLGTGSASDAIGNITGSRLVFSDTASSTITKATAIELDFTNSLATTKYGIILSGDANSGFGVATPASRITAAGDIETVGNGLGLIVAQETSGTRYRIYVNAAGTLSIQLA